MKCEKEKGRGSPDSRNGVEELLDRVVGHDEPDRDVSESRTQREGRHSLFAVVGLLDLGFLQESLLLLNALGGGRGTLPDRRHFSVGVSELTGRRKECRNDEAVYLLT